MSVFLDIIRSCKVFSAIPPSIPSVSTCIIGTHDGGFHCDEALAIGMLLMHPTFQDRSQIVRTRNPSILDQCNIVVDVGAVYDPSKNRFDHHQREFQGTLDGYNTRLSSAGLVYKHFGHDIIRNILHQESSPYAFDNSFIEACYHKVYRNFLEHIDAIDNGIAVSDGEIKYRISTTLSDRVGRLNPGWNAPTSVDILNNRFLDAVALTSTEFFSIISDLASSWWPARSIVKEALDQRFSVDPSGKIIILPQVCPWKEHLFELEEQEKTEQVLYALYQDTGGSWRIQAVPPSPNSFESRKKLPEPWRGVRDEALSEKVGVSGCIFIHASGFIGGHQTKEGAIFMAKKALEL